MRQIGKTRSSRLLGEDAELLQAVGRGEFALNGFRNRDVQAILYQLQPRDMAQKRRHSAAVGRRPRMLRAHRLIRKVPRTHRHQLTERGRSLITALQSAQATTVRQLVALAA